MIYFDNLLSIKKEFVFKLYLFLFFVYKFMDYFPMKHLHLTHFDEEICIVREISLLLFDIYSVSIN